MVALITLYLEYHVLVTLQMGRGGLTLINITSLVTFSGFPPH